MSCQNSVHCATRNVAVTRTEEAMKSGSLNQPMSNRRPKTRPGMKTSAYCSLGGQKNPPSRTQGTVIADLNGTYPSPVQ